MVTRDFVQLAQILELVPIFLKFQDALTVTSLLDLLLRYEDVQLLFLEISLDLLKQISSELN